MSLDETSAPRDVVVLVEPQQLRRWHLDLLQALASGPSSSVQLTWASTGRNSARTMEMVMALERTLARRTAGAAARVEAAAAAAFTSTVTPVSDARRLVLDLSPTPTWQPDIETWCLCFDGRAGEAAALAALVAGRTPVVTVERLGEDEAVVLAAGRPGSESPGTVALAFADLLVGCRTLLVAAVSGHRLTLPELPPSVGGRTLTRHLVKTAVGAIAYPAYRTLYRTPHWRVGWRRLDNSDAPGTLEIGEHPRQAWIDLPDDGTRFYADPFPVVHQGREWLFVEDFEHRAGRGVISVVEFGPDGPLSTPRPVLRHEVHLSYPFVLADEGQLWMVPETSAAGRIELYRALDFPDRWVRDSVLVDDVEASDATIFRKQGSWWMLATVRSGGSFSDALHIWRAPRLRGPWIPHRSNPVLLDIATARPAGQVHQRGGRLLRPAQDGRAGYGAAITLVEITSLDSEHFAQRVLDVLGPGPRWPGRRLHTLNRAGSLEVIDGSGMAPRFWRPRGN